MSISQSSDIDCSQAQETMRMLNLAVAQIEMSMKDGDDSVDTLINTFTEMVGRVQLVETLAKEKSNKSNDMAAIVTQCEAVSRDMLRAIVAFQFYDKLTQRLGHISDSLGAISKIVVDETSLSNDDEWRTLQANIKSKYSMPAEHKVFELIMQGVSVDDAVKEALVNPKSSVNDIELF